MALLQGLPSLISAKEVAKITDQELKEDLCQVDSTAFTISLSWEMRVNPNNEDAREFIAACMVGIGLRPQGYTAEDYDDYSGRIGEQIDNDPEFRENSGNAARIRRACQAKTSDRNPSWQ